MEKSPLVTGLRSPVMARQNAQRRPRRVDQELMAWAVTGKLRAHNCVKVVARRGFISRFAAQPTAFGGDDHVIENSLALALRNPSSRVIHRRRDRFGPRTVSRERSIGTSPSSVSTRPVLPGHSLDGHQNIQVRGTMSSFVIASPLNVSGPT